jgi:uncharacterized protein
MGNAFSKITFTDSVKIAQTLYGSRESNRRLEKVDSGPIELSKHEVTFISQRDSFYQATVTEAGWPYVQHRGGVKGFLKILDHQTIGYADFRGNQQYLSVGNLTANDRISLILIDYPNRRRLKIWGHARIVHAADHPDIISLLRDQSYPAKIERGIVIHIEAFDWNCPQHITPRFTQAEYEDHKKNT